MADHRAEVSRFVSSSSPVLEKVDTWMEDWQVSMTHKMDRMEQELEYNIQTLRDQVKMLEEVMVEGFDRQWQCNGGIVNTRHPSPTTTRATTTTTRRTTMSTTRKTTSLSTTTRTESSTELSTEYYDIYDEIYDSLDEDHGEEEIVSNLEDCWRQKIEDSRSRSGVYTFRSGGREVSRRRCDMETEGGGWTVC